ncbi:hypothetical protein PHYSODRAFT_256073 [Phytophthora sojae]|uniref:Reverse transcriptase n=1 Tax=Phytophthora sojae (strain P6497) TaxID=1094619 RepID=G4YIP3_PHYSP|nr:hypothetical protein PHYSODRAFT_256073 [Phytophthora sojae]EGZ28167.1 hypothetical protein PHYSODRAFT_256073 [Phytophthora sojae]|eukprot:XP_009515442.1 hypothetical protein PHYSODRAFT_256073 [Phytophthora sojae]
MAEFAINNSVHASTGHTPFYVNAIRHPRLPSLLGMVAPSLSGGGSTTATQQPQNAADTCTVSAATTRKKKKKHASVQNTDADKSKKKKKIGSVQGTDTAKTNAEAGPTARNELNSFSSDAINFVQRRQAVIRTSHLARLARSGSPSGSEPLLQRVNALDQACDATSHVDRDVRRGLRGLSDLSPQDRHLLLQSGELPALMLFHSSDPLLERRAKVNPR